jgi:toxin CptA
LGDYNVKPLVVDLRPSYYLAAILGIASALAIIALCVLPLPWWWKLAGVVAMVIGCAYHLWRDVLRQHPQSWVRLEVLRDNTLMLTRRNGEQIRVQVLPITVVTAYCVVLNVRLPGKLFAQSTVLLADSADKDALRRLRVWLSWASLEQPDAAVKPLD